VKSPARINWAHLDVKFFDTSGGLIFEYLLDEPQKKIPGEVRDYDADAPEAFAVDKNIYD